MDSTNYLDVNRDSWNRRTSVHLDSAFYDMPAFLQGKSSLNSIERELLPELNGKSLLHLQCHFGQDSLSLARMGASVTGIDLSDKAIDAARNLATQLNLPAQFVCTDVYSTPDVLPETFDVVFTSYGTIGWLPDLDRWASVVSRMLKPGGTFVFAEFHPVVWMFDDAFTHIRYAYFNEGVLMETESGTYADRNADMQLDYHYWNHSLEEVLNSLMRHGLQLNTFREYNYSPYNCFQGTEEFEPGKFHIQSLGHKIPMVFALKATKA